MAGFGGADNRAIARGACAALMGRLAADRIHDARIIAQMGGWKQDISEYGAEIKFSKDYGNTMQRRYVKVTLAVSREVVGTITDFVDAPAVLYRWRDEMADLIESAPFP